MKEYELNIKLCSEGFWYVTCNDYPDLLIFDDGLDYAVERAIDEIDEMRRKGQKTI